MIELVLTNRTKKRAFKKAFFQGICNAAEPELKLLQRHRAEVGIILIGKVAMRTLNRKRRNKDTSTDVLSFPLHMKPISGYTGLLLGDLFICPEVVRAKAEESGMSVRERMIWTVLHGLFHLAGYDHTTMRTREQRILKVLNP